MRSFSTCKFLQWAKKKGRLAGENLRLCKNNFFSWIIAKLLHEREKIAPSSDNKRFKTWRIYENICKNQINRQMQSPWQMDISITGVWLEKWDHQRRNRPLIKTFLCFPRKIQIKSTIFSFKGCSAAAATWLLIVRVKSYQKSTKI